ncbi:MAG: hypothetical protein QW298_01500 [Candidatus Micrarchaeaceae archaeon]
MQGTDAINKVQDAENRAKELIEKVEKEKNDKIAAAKEKARAILAEAEAKAKSTRSEILENAEKAATELRSRKIAEAKSAAASAGRLKLSATSRKKIANEIAKLILGA